MPVRINLFHEEERARLDRSRDPFKIAIYVAVGIGLALVAYYASVYMQVGEAKNQLRGLQADFKKQKPIQEQFEKEEADLNRALNAHKALMSRIEDRIFMAPLIAKVLATRVSRNIQINQLSGTIVDPQRMEIILEGLCVGQEPRSVAEILRSDLEAAFAETFPGTTGRFELLEENPEALVLGARKFRNANYKIRLVIPLEQAEL